MSACSNTDDDTAGNEEGLLLKTFSLRVEQGENVAVVPGEIDHDKGVITVKPGQQWINNIRGMSASFTPKSADVRVGGELQESGVTENDFTQDVAFTVKGVSGASRDYTVRLLSPQTTGLPIMRVSTENGKGVTSKEDYVSAVIDITDYAGGSASLEETTGGIRGRGNTTWKYVKKPYRLKFDSKVSLFGLGEAKSWVLLASYLDPTLMTATVAFEVGRALDLPFVNHANHVELFLNGEYLGSYVLTEQVQVNPNRLDIDETEDWFLELDTYYDEAYKFRSDYLKLPVNIKSPELEDLDPSDAETVKDDIKAGFDAMEAALFGGGFPANDYGDLVDTGSVIDYLLVNEIVRNAEIIHPKSVFMFRTKDGKFNFGPVWDFDWAFGYSGNGDGFNYFEKQTQLFYHEPGYSGSFVGYKMFLRFFDDPGFVTAYKARWNEVKGSLQGIETFISTTGASLERSAAENFRRWSYNTPVYEDEVAAMGKWFGERIDMLDEKINGM